MKRNNLHFLALLLIVVGVIAMTVLTACPQPTGNNDITYTVAQVGGTSETATTTGLVFTFDNDVEGLTAAEITISGAASKGSATLSGSGKTWTLSGITVSSQGNATVLISKDGIEDGNKTVEVYKANVGNITYTVAQVGGVSGTTTTTGLLFTFSEAVTGLTVDDIRVEDDASKGSATLSGSGTTWTLSGITVNGEGFATVSIDKDGIESDSKTVAVYKITEPNTDPKSIKIIGLDAQYDSMLRIMIMPNDYTFDDDIGLTAAIAGANAVTPSTDDTYQLYTDFIDNENPSTPWTGNGIYKIWIQAEGSGEYPDEKTLPQVNFNKEMVQVRLSDFEEGWN
ncbi:MAG: hypothetical protein LBM77_11165 [Spirochaetaceae bacterium]|jgi:hypothetical protein|nr:hypothetical protein [Spirochaetaceae bacterium]